MKRMYKFASNLHNFGIKNTCKGPVAELLTSAVHFPFPGFLILQAVVGEAGAARNHAS